MGSICNTPRNKTVITPQVPNSTGSNVLVTISIKATPVIIVINPTATEIRPEYVTLISANIFLLSDYI